MSIKGLAAAAALAAAALAHPRPGVGADASDDYPIPNRILKTPAPSISTWPPPATSNPSTTSAT